MSNSVQPHRWEPTRLPHPWDSPGTNTGVGCHFLLQCMKVKVKSLSRVRLLATPWTAAYQAPPSMGFARQEYWSGLPLPSLIALTRQNFFGKGMSLLFNERPRFDPWVRKIFWRREWQPNPVFLPGESNGWGAGSLYLWGH